MASNLTEDRNRAFSRNSQEYPSKNEIRQLNPKDNPYYSSSRHYPNPFNSIDFNQRTTSVTNRGGATDHVSMKTEKPFPNRINLQTLDLAAQAQYEY